MADIELWVIYDHPTDYPEHFVVRRWVNNKADNVCQLADTLEQARSIIPRDLVCIPRAPGDDGVIAECWL